MTQTYDLTGNTLLVDGITPADGSTVAGLDASNILVGSVIESAGTNITIAAEDTLAEALQAIADVADPGV